MPHNIFPLDSFCPLSFCPHIILSPGNRLMIYTIYPCPVSIFPLDSLCPHIILPPPPIILPPGNCLMITLFTHVPYHFPSRFILPPGLSGFILPPGKRFMIYTIYPCPISFSSWIHFAPISFCPLSFCPGEKSFNYLHYLLMSRIILPPW